MRQREKKGFTQETEIGTRRKNKKRLTQNGRSELEGGGRKGEG